MISELKNFARSLLSGIIALVAFMGFFFTFGLRNILIFGKEIFIPLPTAAHSFAATFFEHMKTDLVPGGVKLIVLSPLTAFLAQIKVALLLAFIAVFPLFLYNIINYLSPALFAREKKAFSKAFFPSIALFFAGCVFAYTVVIPPTFAILYKYTVSLDAIPFFEVGEFITLIFAFVFSIGLMFLLPVFMYFLTVLKIVQTDFWRAYWRQALFSFLVLSAIITPDGSGIGMTFLTIPLITLYGVGTIISNK